MATATMSNFEVIELSPKIGSEVRTDKATLLSGERTQEIRQTLERRGVIAFPEINLTDAEQVAFTKTLGTFAHEEARAVVRPSIR